MLAARPRFPPTLATYAGVTSCGRGKCHCPAFPVRGSLSDRQGSEWWSARASARLVDGPGWLIVSGHGTGRFFLTRIESPVSKALPAASELLRGSAWRVTRLFANNDLQRFSVCLAAVVLGSASLLSPLSLSLPSFNACRPMLQATQSVRRPLLHELRRLPPLLRSAADGLGRPPRQGRGSGGA